MKCIRVHPFDWVYSSVICTISAIISTRPYLMKYILYHRNNKIHATICDGKMCKRRKSPSHFITLLHKYAYIERESYSNWGLHCVPMASLNINDFPLVWDAIRKGKMPLCAACDCAAINLCVARMWHSDAARLWVDEINVRFLSVACNESEAQLSFYRKCDMCSASFIRWSSLTGWISHSEWRSHENA